MVVDRVPDNLFNLIRRVVDLPMVCRQTAILIHGYLTVSCHTISGRLLLDLFTNAD